VINDAAIQQHRINRQHPRHHHHHQQQQQQPAGEQRRRNTSNDVVKRALRAPFLSLMVSSMRSDFAGFNARSARGVSDYGAGRERRQRSTNGLLASRIHPCAGECSCLPTSHRHQIGLRTHTP